MSNNPIPSKAERLAEVFNRLSTAPAVSTYDDAYALLCETIDAVEDEWTGIPNNPATWMTDGRMYPPQLDNRISVRGQPDTFRFRSKSHWSIIGANGAITITKTDGTVIFEKAGADGQVV